MKPFVSRSEAGKQLAHKLESYATQGTLVLGLARGGIPVAFEIAKALGLPLDVFIVRKLGVPGHEELAMGAIASGGITLLNNDIIKQLSIPATIIEKEVAKETIELERREKLYRGHKPFPIIKDKIILLVDDGIATGASMRVAIKALKRYQPAQIIVAAPTCAIETFELLTHEADHIVCLATPNPYVAVGLWYEHFTQVSDEEVKYWLEQDTKRL